MSIGHRASKYIRAADLIVAGLSARPEGLRESALMMVATTRTGSTGSDWETWGDGAIAQGAHAPRGGREDRHDRR